MFQKINQPKRNARAHPHFRCIGCNFVIAAREFHLEIYHEDEINITELRNMENGKELDDFFAKWFTETKEPLSHNFHSHNPLLTLSLVNDQNLILKLIEQSGSVGIILNDISRKMKLKRAVRILNILRKNNLVYHDLIDNKWKLIQYREKRREGDSMNWCVD